MTKTEDCPMLQRCNEATKINCEGRDFRKCTFGQLLVREDYKQHGKKSKYAKYLPRGSQPFFLNSKKEKPQSKRSPEICKTRATSQRKRYVPSDCKWCSITFCEQRDRYMEAQGKNEKAEL